MSARVELFAVSQRGLRPAASRREFRGNAPDRRRKASHEGVAPQPKHAIPHSRWFIRMLIRGHAPATMARVDVHNRPLTGSEKSQDASSDGYPGGASGSGATTGDGAGITGLAVREQGFR